MTMTVNMPRYRLVGQTGLTALCVTVNNRLSAAEHFTDVLS